ncbi:MAG TPA: medium chain dehydrogenase/reductase family protein [Vicinamibacterales bacterium]|nr:medium chain dehydrogenase/reductase family protein [Vicinamibacterales bacterium]
MRQAVISRHGSPDVFTMRDVEDPAVGPGELRIRVRAAGVNFADILARLGLYPDAPPPPMVVGYEVAGRVEGVGGGVTGFSEGERVVALTRFGGYSDTVVVPAGQVFRVPEALSDSEAAAVPVNYLTAALALYRMAALNPGEVVLVHNAGGGVGIAATQLARLRRATVIGTASAFKHDALRSFGIDHAIDYRHADVAMEVRRITRGRGADVILDPIGGRSFLESYRMLAPLGRLVVLGLSAVAPGERRSAWHAFRTWVSTPRFNPMSLINRNRGVFGLHIGHLWDERRQLVPLMDMLLAELSAGRLRPIVARTFPLDRAADAHRFIQSRANIGKVVLTT